MTRFVTRLILAMLTLPICAVVFVLCMVAAVAAFPGGPLPPGVALLVWLIVYLVLGVYWTGIWWSTVRWTPRRITLTALAALFALAFGVLGGVFVAGIPGGPPSGIGVLFGGGIPPTIWVICTVLIWRETREERTARLARLGIRSGSLRCPLCSYSMEGLHTSDCPECGGRFTLEQLIGAQDSPNDPAPHA